MNVKSYCIAVLLLVFIFLTSCSQNSNEQIESTSLFGSETTNVSETNQNIREDQFVRFQAFPGNYGVFFGKIPLAELILPDDAIAIRFEVLGIKEENSGFTIYEIRIKNIYGSDMDYDKNKIYRMAFRGTCETPLYGRPTLQIGMEYVRVNDKNFEQYDLMQATIYYKVIDQIDGTYVYGYGVDLSSTKCAIPIVDENENAIYEKGKHDKILTYLQSVGQSIPVFEYKCEINALIKEIQER